MISKAAKRRYDKRYCKRKAVEIRNKRAVWYAANKEDVSEYNRMYALRHENPEEWKAYREKRIAKAANARHVKSWHEANPGRVKAYRRRHHLFKAYGITLEQYEDMLRKQHGRCASCGGMMKPPHIDHNHKTKVVRGLLCGSCNLGLGCFKDSVKNMRKAIKYLLDKRTGI